MFKTIYFVHRTRVISKTFDTYDNRELLIHYASRRQSSLILDIFLRTYFTVFGFFDFSNRLSNEIVTTIELLQLLTLLRLLLLCSGVLV
jgi:hypothetical protein